MVVFTMAADEVTGGFGEGDEESEFEQVESEMSGRALGAAVLRGQASGGLGLQLPLPQAAPR